MQPKRKVRVSVTSVLSSLASSSDTASAWAASLRVLSSAASSSLSSFSSTTADSARWVLPLALSLKSWTRSGRREGDFWKLVNPSSIFATNQTLLSITTTTTRNSNNNHSSSSDGEDDGDAVVTRFLDSALKKWHTAGEWEAALIVASSTLSLPSSPSCSSDSKTKEASAQVIMPTTLTMSVEPLLRFAIMRAQDLSQFCSFVDLAAHAQASSSSSSSCSSNDRQKQKDLMIEALVKCVSHIEDGSVRLSLVAPPQQAASSSASSWCPQQLQSLWKFTAWCCRCCCCAPSSSSDVARCAKIVALFCVKHCDDAEQFAFMMDRDLYRNSSSVDGHHCSSHPPPEVASEALLLAVIDRFACGDNHQEDHTSRRAMMTSKLLRVADRLFPQVARGPAIYASVLRALREQGAWEAALEYSSGAPSFVRGDLNPALIKHIFTVSSSSFKMMPKTTRTCSSSEDATTKKTAVLNAAVSDIVDVYASSIRSETDLGGGCGVVSTSDALGEVVHAALNAHRWDAALSVLQRILLHERLQLAPSVVASIIDAAPNRAVQNSVILNLAHTARRVPFFAPMVAASLRQRCCAVDDRNKNVQYLDDGNSTMTTASCGCCWAAALTQLRAMSIIRASSSSPLLSPSSLPAVRENSPSSRLPLLPYSKHEEQALCYVVQRGLLRLFAALVTQCDFSSNNNHNNASSGEEETHVVVVGRPLLAALHAQKKKPELSVMNSSDDDDDHHYECWIGAVDALLRSLSRSCYSSADPDDGSSVVVGGVRLEGTAAPLVAHFLVCRHFCCTHRPLLSSSTIDRNLLTSIALAAARATTTSGGDEGDRWVGFELVTRAVRAATSSALSDDVGHEYYDEDNTIKTVSSDVINAAHQMISHLEQLWRQVTAADGHEKDGDHVRNLTVAFLIGIAQGSCCAASSSALPSSSSSTSSTSPAAGLLKLISRCLSCVAATIPESTRSSDAAFQRAIGKLVVPLLELRVANNNENKSKNNMEEGDDGAGQRVEIASHLETILRSAAGNQATTEAAVVDVEYRRLLTMTRALRAFELFDDHCCDDDDDATTEESLLNEASRRTIVEELAFAADRHFFCAAAAGDDPQQQQQSLLLKKACSAIVARQQQKSTSNQQWCEAARLVSLAWRCDGVPPQSQLAQLLAQYGASVPMGVAALWEHKYKAGCPIASPSLLAAFVRAKKSQ